MSLPRRTRIALPLAATVLGLVLLAVPGAALFAAPVESRALEPDRSSDRGFDQPLFTWSGTVDREVFIVMRGRSVTTEGRDAGLPNRVRLGGEVPRGFGVLRVNVEEGRGDVDVLEQPTPRNGYQAVIRIRDPRSGADRYRLTAIWTGDARDRDYRDRDGRYDEDRDGRGNDWRDRDGRGNGHGHAYGHQGRDGDEGWSTRGGYDDRGNGNGFADHGALLWNGPVDDVVEIRIQDRRVDYVTRSGKQLREARSEMTGAGLPRQAVNVVLDRADGRGEVAIVQQPNARNDYTAVIRVYDPRGGASMYGLVARW